MKDINIPILETVCSLDIRDFHQLGTYVATSKTSGYTFIDRGGSVLGVAHLDTVQQGTFFEVYFFQEEGDIVFSPRLDDRLGVYLLLDYIPEKYGLVYDILLCEDEEYGMSTAAAFEPSAYGKEYNWMFEFDRGGQDTVMYRYQTSELSEWLRQAGCKIGHGTYTDIVDLEHLEVVGINFSTGYYNYHQINAYAVLEETRKSVADFVRFYTRFAHKKISHTPRPKVKYAWQPRDWDDRKDSYTYTKLPAKTGEGDLYTWEKWGYVTCPRCTGAYETQEEYDCIEELGYCIDCSRYYGTTKVTEHQKYAEVCPVCGEWFTDLEDITYIEKNKVCEYCWDKLLLGT